MERPTTEQPHDELARNFGSCLTRSTHGHRGADKIAQQPRDSRPPGGRWRWAHPPPTGGDGPTIIVFSVHFRTFVSNLSFSRLLVPKTAKTRPLCSPRMNKGGPSQAPSLRTLGIWVREREISRFYTSGPYHLHLQSRCGTTGLALARIACGTRVNIPVFLGISRKKIIRARSIKNRRVFASKTRKSLQSGNSRFFLA